MPLMLYRFMCRFNDVFGLSVLVAYVLAFILAFIMVFLFPPGALLLVLVGISGFVVVWVISLSTRGLERKLARSLMQSVGCPNCGSGLVLTPVASMPGHEGILRVGEPESVYHCAACSHTYEASGARHDRDADSDVE